MGSPLTSVSRAAPMVCCLFFLLVLIVSNPVFSCFLYFGCCISKTEEVIRSVGWHFSPLRVLIDSYWWSPPSSLRCWWGKAGRCPCPVPMDEVHLTPAPSQSDSEALGVSALQPHQYLSPPGLNSLAHRGCQGALRVFALLPLFWPISSHCLASKYLLTCCFCSNFLVVLSEKIGLYNVAHHCFPHSSVCKDCLQCRRFGSGRSPEEGNGNPLQYSCLDDPLTEESLGSQESDTITESGRSLNRSFHSDSFFLLWHTYFQVGFFFGGGGGVVLHDLWDISSPTIDPTWAPSSESPES